MTDLTTTAPAGLPATLLDQITKGIAENRAPTTTMGGGKPLLRLLRDGIWVFGQENIEVQDGSHWMVLLPELKHGWVCWIDGGPNAKNELAGEIMGPMWEPRVAKPPPIEGNAFKEQFGCELRCLTGDDTGIEVLFKTPSDGGIRAMVKLRDDIQRHLLNGGAEFPCPVVEMSQESYNHSKWGKIYKPILTIMGWCDMAGNMVGEGLKSLAAAAPEPAPAKPRQRRSPVAQPTVAAAPPLEPRPEPVPTQAVHTGQRRRPAVR